jgi:hypothetical protein
MHCKELAGPLAMGILPEGEREGQEQEQEAGGRRQRPFSICHLSFLMFHFPPTSPGFSNQPDFHQPAFTTRPYLQPARIIPKTRQGKGDCPPKCTAVGPNEPPWVEGWLTNRATSGRQSDKWPVQ